MQKYIFKLLFIIFLFLNFTACSIIKGKKAKEGVKIGVITYSFRSMPSSAADIVKYCKQTGITSLELMGNVVEEYAGIPSMPPRPKRGIKLSDTEKMAYDKAVQEATTVRKKWRLSLSMNKYKTLRKMFNKAGIDIHIVKFSPANWSDEEIDYAFKAAKVLGAVGISNEIGHKAARRLGKFAEKHDAYAILHNHLQPGEPGFNFDDFLAYSPNNMLNFDVGHYVGATGKHPNEVIEKYHNRIVSLHFKDKTSKNNNPANQNRPWGQGDTPLDEILELIKKNNWPIHCDIELEYKVPTGSDAVKEVKKCFDYCKKALQ